MTYGRSVGTKFMEVPRARCDGKIRASDSSLLDTVGSTVREGRLAKFLGQERTQIITLRRVWSRCNGWVLVNQTVF